MIPALGKGEPGPDGWGTFITESTNDNTKGCSTINHTAG
jgi:hypothetical protein